MKRTPESIEFSSLSNALDSIDQAVSQLAWDDATASEAQKLKNAVRNIAHAVELLLKERLRQIHPALVWENVDKFPNLNARTVSVDQALSRLDRIGNIKLRAADEDIVRSLRTTRNAIEHSSWRTTRHEAEVIVGAGLSFAISFAKEHLGIDVFGYAHRKDDTWQQLIAKSDAFTEAHTRRFEERAADKGQRYIECDFCHAMAVRPEGGSCDVCGHWHYTPETDPPF